MILPNFLIIGVKKGGTTSLIKYLDQHPDIFMAPVRSSRFFISEGDEKAKEVRPHVVTTLGEYKGLFRDVSGERAIGENSNAYFNHPGAPGSIRRYVPNVKLVALLRNPAERAYSSYTMHVSRGQKPVDDFSSVVKRNIETYKNPGNVGFYYRHLRNYYDHFDPSRIKVYLFEDFIKDPRPVMKDLFAFLGVNKDFIPNTLKKYNPSGIPDKMLLHKLLTSPNIVKTAVKKLFPREAGLFLYDKLFHKSYKKIPLPEEARKILTGIYREDILKLQGLLGRDLSSWLS